jgi:hypothetical protein
MIFEDIDPMTVEQKKKILADWQALLPGMKMLGTGKDRYFSKFIGPLEIVVLFECMHGSRDYRCKASTTTYLRGDYGGGPKSQSLTVPHNKHEGMYLAEFERIKRKFLLPIAGPISVSMIFEAYKKYAEKYIMDTDTPEEPALIAAWAGMDEVAKEAADWAEEVLKKQISEINDRRETKGIAARTSVGDYTFKNYTSFEDWRAKLDARLADRAGLQKLFEDKVKEFKLTKVPREELICE